MGKTIQFLKPNWGKIVFLIILGVASLFVVNETIPEPGVLSLSTQRGFPFAFLIREFSIFDGFTTSLSFWALLIDLVIWYLVSCFIVFAWRKYKKKNKN